MFNQNIYALILHADGQKHLGHYFGPISFESLFTDKFKLIEIDSNSKKNCWHQDLQLRVEI